MKSIVSTNWYFDDESLTFTDIIFHIIYYNPKWFGLFVFVLIFLLKWLLNNYLSIPITNFNFNRLIYILELRSGKLDKSLVNECIDILSIYPESVNIPMAPKQFTPFQRACELESVRLINFMLRCGANIHSRTQKNSTPFHLATRRIAEKHLNDFTILEILLSSGSDINAKKQHGFTALHISSIFGHYNLCKWLLHSGANADIENDDGYTASDLSDINGKTKVSILLESFMQNSFEYSYNRVNHNSSY